MIRKYWFISIVFFLFATLPVYADFTYIDGANGNSAGSGTTVDCSTTLNIAAGDLLVAYTKFNGATDTTIAIADTSGNNVMTVTTHYDSTLWISAMGYRLVGEADAAATIRVTLGANRSFKRVVVLQFRPDSGDTVSLDAGPNADDGDSALAQSGNITTTGTDEVVVVGGTADNTVIADSKINEVASDGQEDSGAHSAWYRIITSTFVNGHGEGTVDNEDWVCDILAFKSTAPDSYIPKVIIIH